MIPYRARNLKSVFPIHYMSGSRISIFACGPNHSRLTVSGDYSKSLMLLQLVKCICVCVSKALGYHLFQWCQCLSLHRRWREDLWWLWRARCHVCEVDLFRWPRIYCKKRTCFDIWDYQSHVERTRWEFLQRILTLVTLSCRVVQPGITFIWHVKVAILIASGMHSLKKTDLFSLVQI